jgi:hypothetical protein
VTLLKSAAGRRARRYVLAAACGSRAWTTEQCAAFRAVALDAGVTKARLVGIVENESRRLG